MERPHEGALKAVAPNDAEAAEHEQPLVYTVAEVAARLKVSAGTVRNMIDQGELYAVRLHVRRIVVPAWALDDLLARSSAPVVPLALHRPASNA